MLPDSPRLTLLRGSDVCLTRRRPSRRDWLALAGGAAGLSALPWPARLALAADDLARSGRRLIVLWTAGGASQIDTFDPKENGSVSGGVRPIATTVPGLRLAENLPRLAKQADRLCLIRSMTGKEGSHPRATHLMRTGYLPMAATAYPSIGSHVSDQLGTGDGGLPAFVRIAAGGQNPGGAGLDGGGLLGNRHAPLAVADPSQPPAFAKPNVDRSRYERRLRLLDGLDAEYARAGHEAVVAPHRETVRAASRMILSPEMKAFDLGAEDDATREAFGTDPFGRACLLSRRLIEHGVSCVEITSGGWDTHDDNRDRVAALCGPLDRGFAALLGDLADRGMLDSTLVVCMGDFGRTPRINARGGRDHFPKVYSVALAGGGVAGGTVIGASTEDGGDVADRPVGVADLLRTIYRGVGVDPDREHPGPGNRPIRVLDGGTVVDGVFA